MLKIYMERLAAATEAKDHNKVAEITTEALNHFAAPIVAIANITSAADYPLLVAALKIVCNSLSENVLSDSGRQLVEEITSGSTAIHIAVPRRRG